MAISSAFLTTVRAAIILTPEYAAYQAAVAVLDGASETDRLAKWQLAYGSQAGDSLAMQLRRAIRNVILNQDLSALSTLERESAYRTLEAIYVRVDDKPLTSAEEIAALTELVSAGLAE